MTDKPIIKLKPTEDLNEKIIKEKGNTKCIFYSDDICRKGDKTRDCINCARVEYNSLYSLNWDNQERLEKIIEQKEQECEQLKAEFDKKELIFVGIETSNRIFIEKNNKLKQTLIEIKEITEKQVKRSPDGETFARPEIKQILQKISEVENK